MLFCETPPCNSLCLKFSVVSLPPTPFHCRHVCRNAVSLDCEPASLFEHISQHGIVEIWSFRIGSKLKCLIDGRPIIKSVVTSLHTNTLKHMCLWASSLLDVNDMLTFIIPSTPNDCPQIPLVRETLALWITPPSFRIVAATRALTTFVYMQSVSISTRIGI